MDAAVEVIAVSKPRNGRMALFVVLLVLANLIWAGQAVAVKKIETQLGPFAIAFLPFFVITPLLLPVLWANRRRNPTGRKPTPRDWLQFIIAGVGGQMVAQLGMTWGVVESKASNLAILYLLIPVITAVLASLLLSERITPLRVVCLGVGMVGAALLSVGDLSQVSFLDSKLLFGNVLLIAGCGGAAFYNVYCKGLMTRFPERDILIYSYITATLASLPFLLWKEPDAFSRLMHLHGAEAWMAFMFLPLFVYGISMLMLFYVLQFLPVTIVLASTYLMPVFGVGLAFLMLGERLSRTSMIGAAVVLIATVLIMKFDAAPDDSSATTSAS